MELKRAVSIQDISCFGRCSLTTALPIMSAMGIETAIIPTAVLSTHTGGFKNFTFRDLTDDIMPIIKHWKKENIGFDAVCTGYLGSIEQINIMKDIFKAFRNEALIFVDPAMGDNGKLYTGFDEKFAKKMGSLCAIADVIVPNITEASMMTGIEYRDKGYDKEYIIKLMNALSQMGAKKVIITGVMFDERHQGTAFLDGKTGDIGYYMAENIPVSSHGTGDIFSAVCAGTLVKGGSIYDACKLAADYVIQSIKATIDNKDKYWYGVNFEAAIPSLINEMQKINQ